MTLSKTKNMGQRSPYMIHDERNSGPPLKKPIFFIMTMGSTIDSRRIIRPLLMPRLTVCPTQEAAHTRPRSDAGALCSQSQVL